MIKIIDYSSGNIGSILNMVKAVGFNSEVARGPSDLDSASAIILPGVGSFDAAIAGLRNSGMIEPIVKRVKLDKVPILGICLGMQLLTKGSEEGSMNGLGLIDGYCHKLDKQSLRVPHMGWNELHVEKDSVFFDRDIQERFYFVHSYAVSCNNKKDILTTTEYGNNFVSSFLFDNILGVQFHPEKSHTFGKNFFIKFINSINA
jgi:imidazole glycerol-phosphate synthase subunit HisH